MDSGELTETVNKAKNAVLKRLYKDGILEPEDFEKYSERWQVVMVEGSRFKGWFNKYTGGEEGTYIKYVQFEDDPIGDDLDNGPYGGNA